MQIHVLPFTATMRPFTGDGFTVLEFDTTDDVVYVEEVHASTMDRRNDVAAYREVHEAMLAAALNVEESRAVIQAITDSL